VYALYYHLSSEGENEFEFIRLRKKRLSELAGSIDGSNEEVESLFKELKEGWRNWESSLSKEF
jgi:hypothetical protein